MNRVADFAAPSIPTNPTLLIARWPAKWCCHPDVPRTLSSVQLFRRDFELESVPAAFIVHISADQRYRFWVNGEEVSWGPARGDLFHWRFETLDITPYLKAGKNVLSAQVHYFSGDFTPVAQQTAQIGFLCQGNDAAEAIVNTPKEWKVWHDDSYRFTVEPINALWTYSVVGPCEIFDGTKHPYGWQSPDFDTSAWPNAFSANPAAHYACSDGETLWWLVPRTIPQMETVSQTMGKIVRAEGLTTHVERLDDAPIVIPPNTRVTLLMDRGFETCGFPEVCVSGSAGSVITLSYAEALILPNVKPNDPNRKGNRNEVANRVLSGYVDKWTTDGGAGRILRPLWWRTYRYIELTVETKSDPLVIERAVNRYTGYPFVEKAQFQSTDAPELAEIAAIGWRTARLCAHETYMDCPYYEQLQYAGDTRIQCLVTFYTSGDARLFRNALLQYHDSRIVDGLTQSRYPSRILQVIPPFSLWYIGMVHDYWRHVPNEDKLLQTLLPTVRAILQWFRDHLQPNGLLASLEWWNFVDWCPEWPNGAPPGAQTGDSGIITSIYAIALREASELLRHFGNHKEADDYERESEYLTDAVFRLCCDTVAHRVYDTPERKTASQHAAVLLCLADKSGRTDHRALMERVLTDSTLTQTTFYFRFYLNRALVAAGMANRYLETLRPWNTMRELGLTTWAENPEPTRSDCHAWSASPNYELLATVLGVRPATYGFESVVIEPNPAHLTTLTGNMPHHKGDIVVSLQKTDGETWQAELTLPDGLTGTFVWGGKEHFLSAGTRRLLLLPPLTTVEE